MTLIQQDCQCRRITRLCHFTQSRNLGHIFGDCAGILSRRSLEAASLPHNPTDLDRYDDCDDLVCCSLEYPNVFYFAKVRERDRLFRDWVVLLIKPDLLWQSGTRFCPRNAATARGAYIGEGYAAFSSMFNQNIPGTNFSRSSTHLPCSPTDIQAEVLVPDPISLDDITAIVVEDDAQAKRELCRARLQGIPFDKVITIAPDFFSRNRLAPAIQAGSRVNERRYDDGGTCD